MPRIAVIGAGHAGPVIARLIMDAGYPVSISGSGDPDQIALLAQVLTPGADPGWTADAVADADMVVLSIPLHRLTTLDPSPLAGKTVIDAMNYWPPTDGVQELFEHQRTGSSEIVQQRLGFRLYRAQLHHGTGAQPLRATEVSLPRVPAEHPL